MLLFAGSLGFLWLGTVPLTSGLVGYIFGPAHMSMLGGIVFLGHQIGSFLQAAVDCSQLAGGISGTFVQLGRCLHRTQNDS